MKLNVSILGVAALNLVMMFATSARAADQSLIDAARKEGRVVWYTTQIVDLFARPAAEAFEKKYGIKVDYVRANSADISLRIINEGRAGKMMSDVFDGTSTVPSLKKAGFVLKWLPQSASRLPKEYHDQEGYWVATNIFVLTPGFNTDLVPKGTEPKSWADLLDPKWKGKMLWGFSPTVAAAPGFIGTILAEYGEVKGMDYLRKLAKQNVNAINFASRQVYDQIVAGEYPIGLQIFNHHAVIGAAKGAPVAWIPMNPGLVVMSVVSVTKGGPHPNAGKLLVDFLLSEEGQQLFRKADYIPVDSNVPPRYPSLRPDGKKFRGITMTPERIDGSMAKWVGIYNQLFR